MLMGNFIPKGPHNLIFAEAYKYIQKFYGPQYCTESIKNIQPLNVEQICAHILGELSLDYRSV